MKYIVVPVLVGFFLLFGSSAVKAVPTPGEIDRIEAATRVFQQMPGRIPAYVLENAKGIAVIPGELKGGFVFGGEAGGGVVVSRLPDGSWSSPALISLAGASFGLQIGGEAGILSWFSTPPGAWILLRTEGSKLGGDASVTAGPVGADAGVTTDVPEIYSYVSELRGFHRSNGTGVHTVV